MGFTADYTTLDIYVKVGSGAETLVHSYTRAEVEALAGDNTDPIYYAVYDRLPAVFMGKAVTYITIPQLAASEATYNSAVRYDDASCTMTGLSLDGWTTNMPWTYLMGVTRKYYAGIGDQYLDPVNRTGQDREVLPVLAITGWAGREAQVDYQPYDTFNTYRFFYGQTVAEYGSGILPSDSEKDARCTANNSAKMIYRLTFVVAESHSVTVDSAITGGTVSINPTSALAGTLITVTVTPDEGMVLVGGSIKYTADGGASYTTITAAEGVYSFTMPEANVTVTALFADPSICVTGVDLDKEILTLSAGSTGQLTATITPGNAPNQDVAWSSNNASVAIVDQNGLVRAISEGTANITVTTADGGHSDSCEITVIPAESDHFTIAVLPDTQAYSENYPEIFDQQALWIAANSQSQNIVFAAHLGDIIDDYDNDTQWENAQSSMNIIREAGIPYSVVPGNHDLNFDAGDPTKFDTYFNDFSDYDWYQGQYPADSNTSSYQLFSAMGQDFIVLNLVGYPSRLSDATDWANDVLDQYSDRRAIVVTHGYLGPSGNHSSGNDTSGLEIWNNIVKLHSNVIAVLCGHVDGEIHNTDTGDSGNTIYNLLTCYTSRPDGGNGWLRLYQFYPEENKITAVTYSPYLNEYETDADSQFNLFLDMSSGNEIQGDVDGNGSVDINDVVLTVDFVLGNTEPTPDQLAAADLDDNGSINIQDVVALVDEVLGTLIRKINTCGY